MAVRVESLSALGPAARKQLAGEQFAENAKNSAKHGLQQADGPTRRGTNKFGAKRTTCPHGHKHDSGAEAKRCAALHLLQRAGTIRALEQQPVYFLHNRDGSQIRFENGRAARFKPDFRYEELRRDGAWHLVVEDVKSPVTMTEAFQLRAALWRSEHPGMDLRIVT